jgi:hypothetical protein
MVKILPITYFEKDSEILCSLPLFKDDGNIAVLHRDDFDYLMSRGVSPAWTLRYNTVCLTRTSKAVAVGRLILSAQAGQIVLCLNGDCTDLRRSNLVISPGNAKFDAWDLAHQVHAPIRQRFELQHNYA